MTAISGTRRAIKELADGTVRVQIDVDPQHRKRFFELFADIDMPVALAPLMANFDQPGPETDARIVSAAADAVKGGPLSKLAGMFCSDPAFRSWFQEFAWKEWKFCGGAPKDGTEEEQAAVVLRWVCGVRSRAELDHNAEAAEKFHAIRKSWAFVQADRAKRAARIE